MKALVVAAAAMAVVCCGSPALAADAEATTTPVATARAAQAAQAAQARPKAKPVRIVKLSTSKPTIGSKVVVTGKTSAKSRKVVLQVRRLGPKAYRWVTVTSTTSKKGSFKLKARLKHADIDRVRVVAPRSGKLSRSVTGARKVKVVVPPAPKPTPTTPTTPAATTPPEVVTPEPSEVDAPEVDARAVEAELARLVKGYRAANNLSAVGTDACLSTWAQNFAATMAMTNIFAHSSSGEWQGTTQSILTACAGTTTPATYRQEAIAWVTGTTATEVASAALADMKAAWMHDDVLLSDAGTGRVMQVGAAENAAGQWYLVVAFAAS